MSLKRTLARNVLCNWAGMAVQMLAGFVVAPFLVRHLGDMGYGLWTLIAALTGYFAVLDPLGVCGSVGRSIAFHRAKNDLPSVNSVLSTAIAYLVCVAGVALLATLGLELVFFRLFPSVPVDQVDAVRFAVLLVGINVALTFPLGVFEATLWAYQRFDLMNAIDIPVGLIRAGLSIYSVSSGHGLAGLAVVTLGTSLLGLIAKAIASFSIEPNLRISPTYVSREMARGLVGYGIWYFLLNLARTITPQVSRTVIGNRINIAALTPYSVAASLTGYANSVLIAGTGVLTPVATAMHANEDHERQQNLFLDGGKYCLALVLFFIGLFLCLGKSLIVLWMKPEMEAAALLLIVLALGELLPMSQGITYSLILGMGRHRALACFSLLEIGLVTGSTLWLIGSYGVVGVCVAVAVSAGFCRGLCQWIYGCRLLKVSPWSYFANVHVPAVLAAAPPILLLAVACRWQMPNTWFQLFSYTVIYGACYLLCCCAWLVGCGQVRLRGGELLRGVLRGR